MDPTHDPQSASPGASAGELVVQNGRMAGTSRRLGVPLTFGGSAAGGDVRLNVEGIHPLHCLIAHSPTGVVVRDLESGGTFVNGVRVTVSPLRDGDVLGVGPFQFRVHLFARTE